MVCMLEYSIRHLARSCDWTQPVQLCKWAPGGACWPGCGARTEVGSSVAGAQIHRVAWGRTDPGVRVYRCFKTYFTKTVDKFYNYSSKECQVKARLRVWYQPVRSVYSDKLVVLWVLTEVVHCAQQLLHSTVWIIQWTRCYSEQRHSFILLIQTSSKSLDCCQSALLCVF